MIIIDFKFLSCLRSDNYKSEYNFVETPHKFTIAKLSILKLRSSWPDITNDEDANL